MYRSYDWTIIILVGREEKISLERWKYHRQSSRDIPSEPFLCEHSVHIRIQHSTVMKVDNRNIKNDRTIFMSKWSNMLTHEKRYIGREVVCTDQTKILVKFIKEKVLFIVLTSPKKGLKFLCVCSARNIWSEFLNSAQPL